MMQQEKPSSIHSVPKNYWLSKNSQTHDSPQKAAFRHPRFAYLAFPFAYDSRYAPINLIPLMYWFTSIFSFGPCAPSFPLPIGNRTTERPVFCMVKVTGIDPPLRTKSGLFHILLVFLNVPITIRGFCTWLDIFRLGFYGWLGGQFFRCDLIIINWRFG